MAFPKLYKNSHGVGKAGFNHRKGNTRYLTRIIIFLIDADCPQTLTEICNATGISNELSDSLQWLVSNKIVNKESYISTKLFKFRKPKHGHLYLINPKWKELRDN